MNKLFLTIFICTSFINRFFSQTFPSGFSQVKIATVDAPTAKGCSASGTITREVWNNVTGTFADFPFNSTPSSKSERTLFEGPTNSADNYASRMRGYICPPTTGNYIFWIASDNSSELWLSKNDSPADKVKIASVTGYTSSRNWTKYLSQKSDPISLTAGETYYIEAIHKESNEGDNLAVGWQLPGGALERPIPGKRLSPFLGTTPKCDVKVTPAGSTTFCSGDSVKLNATADAGFAYQWKKNGANILGATATSYTAKSAGDYQVKITMGDCMDWSVPLKVTENSTLTAKITPGGSTTICSGTSVKLFANTCGGYLYQWRKNGSDIPGAIASSYSATSGGNYQVKIIQGSAIAWSALLTVTVNTCNNNIFGDTLFHAGKSKLLTPLLNNDNAFHVDVFPNPNTGSFSFGVCLEDIEEETIEINVVNYIGQSVYTKPARRINGCIKETIELNNTLPPGMYILQITIGSKTENARILLTK